MRARRTAASAAAVTCAIALALAGCARRMRTDPADVAGSLPPPNPALQQALVVGVLLSPQTQQSIENGRQNQRNAPGFDADEMSNGLFQVFRRNFRGAVMLRSPADAAPAGANAMAVLDVTTNISLEIRFHPRASF